MYRALDHRRIKRQCTERRPKRVLAEFPQEIQDFADQFVRMQQERHLADYDPLEHFSRSTVSRFIDATKSAIDAFNEAEIHDRRAFRSVRVIRPQTGLTDRAPGLSVSDSP